MVTIEKLREFGANVDEGLHRCMNNEAFYIKLVDKTINDTSIVPLKEALEKGDLDEAFELAHGLKGVWGNLALTPLFEPMSEVSEFLRSRTEMDYSPYIGKISEKMDELAGM